MIKRLFYVSEMNVFLHMVISFLSQTALSLRGLFSGRVRFGSPHSGHTGWLLSLCASKTQKQGRSPTPALADNFSELDGFSCVGCVNEAGPRSGWCVIPSAAQVC